MDKSVFVALTPKLAVEIDRLRRRITHLRDREAFLDKAMEGWKPGRHRVDEVDDVPSEKTSADAPPPRTADIAAVPDAD